MIFVENARTAGESDAAVINRCIEQCHREHGGGIVQLAAATYHIEDPVCLRSGVLLAGEGVLATRLMATPGLRGPIIITQNAEALRAGSAWFVDEGVPARFGLRDLFLDGEQARNPEGFAGGCGAYLYGKGFEVRGVQISHTLSHGLVSEGSTKGGQRSFQDEPEAFFDVRISRAGGDGFRMRGPHDSVIERAIIAECKERGLAVEAGKGFNGACDINFCHAYATKSVAIDIHAKIKAGFLQGDTGQGAGVRINGSDKSYVDRIECFKTKGEVEDFALQISNPYTQVGLARVRADWGTSGVKIDALGCQIGQLDIDGRNNNGGPRSGLPNAGVGLRVSAPLTQIGLLNVRYFEEGIGIQATPNARGLSLRAVTTACANHAQLPSLAAADIDLLIVKENERERLQVQPGVNGRTQIREIASGPAGRVEPQ